MHTAEQSRTRTFDQGNCATRLAGGEPVPMETTGGRRGGAPVATQPELGSTAAGEPAFGARIRVVVVDDHEMFAESIARALDRADEIQVVAIARSCAEGTSAITTHRPDIAVVDYQLPDGDGARLTTSIRELSPESRVIILTGHGEGRIALAALEAGAAGFLTKDKAVDELVLAVRNVHTGESYVPPTVLAGLLPRLNTMFKANGSELTQHEREIVQLLADGLSNEAIAARLVLSKHTVRNHVQNVLSKLGAHSKLEAVAVAVREGLVRRAP